MRVIKVSEAPSIPLLYHTHHSLEADDLPFWLAWARQQGGPILELGCGTGRVLLPLAEAGHTVFGLDRDAAMLDFLRRQVTDETRDRVVLVRGDLRSYCLASRFPLVLMPCNTYSTLALTERRSALTRARLHLAPQGVFIVSMPNPGLLTELPGDGEPENETSFQHPHTVNPVQVSSQWEQVDEGIQCSWHYDHLLPDGRVERLTLSTIHYPQALNEILREFKEVGLDVIGTFGDFERGSYDIDSPSLIIVAQG